MGRSEKMLGRVRRNIGGLQRVMDTEIYESLQLAQQEIILLLNGITKDITVTTVADQATYTLQSNIRSIKAVTTPDEWNPVNQDEQIKFVVPKNWDTIVKMDLTGEPQFWCFNDNMTELKFYPAPTSDGDTITLQCYMKDSDTEIGAGVEPEVESYWDKSMVYYATSEYKDPAFWISLYDKEVEKLRHIPQQSILEPKVKRCSW